MLCLQILTIYFSKNSWYKNIEEWDTWTVFMFWGSKNSIFLSDLSTHMQHQRFDFLFDSVNQFNTGLCKWYCFIFFKKLWYKIKNKSMWIDKCVTCINICFLRILAIPSKTHNQQIHVSFVTTRSIKTIIHNASSSMLIIVIAECSWTNICWHIKFKVMLSFVINVVK